MPNWEHSQTACAMPNWQPLQRTASQPNDHVSAPLLMPETACCSNAHPPVTQSRHKFGAGIRATYEPLFHSRSTSNRDLRKSSQPLLQTLVALTVTVQDESIWGYMPSQLLFTIRKTVHTIRTFVSMQSWRYCTCLLAVQMPAYCRFLCTSWFFIEQPCGHYACRICNHSMEFLDSKLYSCTWYVPTCTRVYPHVC